MKQIYRKYVLQNIFGMIGMSAYVLADTFFISIAAGADGITALNLVLPIYSLIFAIGAMIGSGAATRFKISRASGHADSESYFATAVLSTTALGLCFTVVGILFPDQLLRLLGADEKIVLAGTGYTRIFLSFAPLFMLNHVFNAFTRNDNAPQVAMTATLCSSLFNIVLDYILMFPLGMGIIGAALATAISPAIGILVCFVFHFLSKQNTITFQPSKSFLKPLFRACQLGIAPLIGELSSGITTLVFNYLILTLAGNVGVAAYAVVANVSIVAAAVLNGIAQGGQPLLSECYGKSDSTNLKTLLHLSICYALTAAVLIILLAELGAVQITALFNSEQNPQFTQYAVTGIRLYFTGFFFAGLNIVGTGYFSATENATNAFLISILRGVIAIIPCSLLLAYLFGMTGVWLAFPTVEALTLIVLLGLCPKPRPSGTSFSREKRKRKELYARLRR